MRLIGYLVYYLHQLLYCLRSITLPVVFTVADDITAVLQLILFVHFLSAFSEVKQYAHQSAITAVGFAVN